MRHITILLSLFIIYGSFSFIKVYGATAKSINKHGIELGKRKLYKEAIGEFQKAINKYDKSSAKTYHNIAWAYELKGIYKLATKSYEEALRRNPHQIVSGEKLGFLYYKTKDYINAVRIGEFVLKYDPQNKEVIKWLPDAYMQKLKQEQAILAEKKRLEEERRRKELEDRRKNAKDYKKEKTILYATYDAIIRTGYYFNGPEKGFKYIQDDGLGPINIAQEIYISFTPTESWDFTFKTGNPYLGAMAPNLILNHETLEASFSLANFSLGAGIMFNHHSSNFNTNIISDDPFTVWDLKVGFLFGYKKKNSEIKIKYYPRLIPYDGSFSSNETMDVSYFQLNYINSINSNLKYYSILIARDYYFFNHEGVAVSNYYGVYDIGMGVTLGKFNKKTNKTDMSFTIELIGRFYLMELANTSPYSRIPNGQGWFGMDLSKWLKGDPFSGYWGMGYEVSFKVQEQVMDALFLYQKFIIEMCDIDNINNHFEFNLQIGLGISI